MITVFKAIKGKNWILEPGAVEVVGEKAKANIFKTDSGIIIPVTFGEEEVVGLKLKDIGTAKKIEYIHPGEVEWKTIKLKNNKIKIPLKRGCAMVRIN